MRLSLRFLERQGDDVPHLLIVGANARAGHLVRAVTGYNSNDCVIEGFLDDPERREALEKLGVPYLGPVSALERLMIERVIDRVYVCLPLRSHYDMAQNVLNLCEEAGVPVFMMADVLPLHTESDGMWCTDSVCPGGRPWETAVSAKPEETPLLATLSSAFAGVVSGLITAHRQTDGRHPRPPSLY